MTFEISDKRQSHSFEKYYPALEQLQKRAIQLGLWKINKTTHGMIEIHLRVSCHENDMMTLTSDR